MRDRIAVGVGAVILLTAIGTLLFARYDSGVRLAVLDGQVVITEVNVHSVARENGLQPGMLVVALNDVAFIRFPEYVYPEFPPEPDPDTGEYVEPRPIGIEPSVPTQVPMSEAELAGPHDRPRADLLAAGDPVVGPRARVAAERLEHDRALRRRSEQPARFDGGRLPGGGTPVRGQLVAGQRARRVRARSHWPSRSPSRSPPRSSFDRSRRPGRRR